MGSKRGWSSGVELDAEGAEVAERAVDLLQRGIHVVEREGGGEAHEAVRIPAHQLGHLVVGPPRELRGDLRRADLLQRRNGQDEHLGVVGVCLHPPQAGVEVGEDRVEPEDALLVVAELRWADRGGQVLLQPFQVAGREDVGEGVDFPHRSIVACAHRAPAPGRAHPPGRPAGQSSGNPYRYP